MKQKLVLSAFYTSEPRNRPTLFWSSSSLMGQSLSTMRILLVNLFSHTLVLTVAKMSLAKRSAPYWSNPPFLIFLTFGHYGTQFCMPCQFILDIWLKARSKCYSMCYTELIVEDLPHIVTIWTLWQRALSTISFVTVSRHSAHCLNHLYAAKLKPPGAMRLRPRGHDFELPKC